MSISVREMFREGTEVDVLGEPGRIAVRHVGDLQLPSGRIVAFDPFVSPHPRPRVEEPLDRHLAPGVYRVDVSLVTFGEDSHSVAFARVRFSDAEPASWVNVVPEGERSEPEKVFGYAVDYVTGCFADIETADRYWKAGEPLVEMLTEAIGAGTVGGWHSASLTVDEGSALNLVAFSTGVGDGFYPSYWGLDANGEPAWLVTDFGICTSELTPPDEESDEP